MSAKHALLPTAERTLSVMRWIARSIPVESRWFPVFARYLLQLGQAVNDLGGNSGTIVPSPTGGIVKWPPPGHPGRPGHPHLPDHGDVQEFVGKIEALVHDRFGDFEGFVLEERHTGDFIRFESRQPGIAELAKEAWGHDIAVSIVTAHDDWHRPTGIVFRRNAGSW